MTQPSFSLAPVRAVTLAPSTPCPRPSTTVPVIVPPESRTIDVLGPGGGGLLGPGVAGRSRVEHDVAGLEAGEDKRAVLAGRGLGRAPEATAPVEAHERRPPIPAPARSRTKPRTARPASRTTSPRSAVRRRPSSVASSVRGERPGADASTCMSPVGAGPRATRRPPLDLQHVVEKRVQWLAGDSRHPHAAGEGLFAPVHQTARDEAAVAERQVRGGVGPRLDAHRLQRRGPRPLARDQDVASRREAGEREPARGVGAFGGGEEGLGTSPIARTAAFGTGRPASSRTVPETSSREEEQLHALAGADGKAARPPVAGGHGVDRGRRRRQAVEAEAALRVAVVVATRSASGSQRSGAAPADRTDVQMRAPGRRGRA